MDTIQPDFLTQLIKGSKGFLFNAGEKAIYCVIAIIIGVIIIRFTKWIILRLMKRAKTSLSLQSFISSFTTFVLYAGLIFVIGIILGIKASAFITLIGAAGIAVGLALQGSLSNFAGGVLILIFKPFRVGDKVIINDVFGVVDEINILYTRLRTWNGKIITMPNGVVANRDIENRSLLDRRIEIDLFFSFEEDVDHLRKIITTAMKKHPKTLKDEPYQLWLQEYRDSTMRMSARCWSKTDDYWDVYWDQIEVIKKALEKEGIHFGLPKTIEIQYNGTVQK